MSTNADDNLRSAAIEFAKASVDLVILRENDNSTIEDFQIVTNRRSDAGQKLKDAAMEYYNSLPK